MKINLDGVTGFGVVGLGKMGADWCAQYLEGGYTVVGFDEKATQRDSAEARVLKALQWIEKKRLGPNKERMYPDGFADEAIKRFTVVDSLEAFMEMQDQFQATLECIFENMKAKQDLFVKLAAGLPEDHIFLSNTSSLDILEMGRPAGITNRLVCTHGMNPVPRMKAVETVKTSEVDEGVFDVVFKILKDKLGKVPFVAPNVTGFWVNHLGVPFWNEAVRALERGEITPEHGDTGLKFSLGHPQGAFKLMDFIGLDTMYRVVVEMYLATNDPRYYPPVLLIQLVKQGHFGIKSGQGFYRWEGGKPVEPVDFTPYLLNSPELEDIPI